MGDSGGSVVSIDVERISFGGKVQPTQLLALRFLGNPCRLRRELFSCRVLPSSRLFGCSHWVPGCSEGFWAKNMRALPRLCLYFLGGFCSIPWVALLLTEHIHTNHGAVSVVVYGDHDKPACYLSRYRIKSSPAASQFSAFTISLAPPVPRGGSGSNFRQMVIYHTVDDIADQFHTEAVHMTSKLDRRYCALVEVQACGSLITEEQPHAMIIPMEYFFMGYGLYRPSQFDSSPRSPLNQFCISPELLSPESMGVKLKPIKTRMKPSVLMCASVVALFSMQDALSRKHICIKCDLHICSFCGVGSPRVFDLAPAGRYQLDWNSVKQKQIILLMLQIAGHIQPFEQLLVIRCIAIVAHEQDMYGCDAGKS
ncbi:hypothetical protein GUJ93_ZPchr0002g25125 [Zizania palustris]|uniref:Uncharacterized protein n=1 Tax=Zizania palustris TaxID=103762 RepID=A0A8J5S7J9_ZIZPA|nr:hypothetical protein GUJ93_ZPchr0002g25125 [Zizania palustris]